MAPTPVHNIEYSIPNSIYSPHPKNSLGSWFKTFLGSKETGQAESYQLDNLSPMESEPGLGPTPNIGSVLEQGLPGTPTTETFYNSPHRIKGIVDWFKSLTGSSKKPKQDQGESYELDTVLPWTPTVSRYPPKLPELDLGPAFHVGDILGRDLRIPHMRSSRRIDDDVFPAVIGGMAVFFLAFVFILLCKKIASRSRRKYM